MPYDPNKHHRQSHRLQSHDYTTSAKYFVTIVTHQREKLFGEIVNGEMKLNPLGEIARHEWFKTAELRPYVLLDENEFVVMPTHTHGIIHIVSNVGAERRSAPTENAAPTTFGTPYVDAGSLGAIVRGYKSAVTYAINSTRQTRGFVVWQRNYHDRIIRDDKEYEAIRNYIMSNPINWNEDLDNPDNFKTTRP